MKSNFIQNYERNLVEEAENKKERDIVNRMKELNYSREEILEITGVDILKYKYLSFFW